MFAILVTRIFLLVLLVLLVLLEKGQYCMYRRQAAVTWEREEGRKKSSGLAKSGLWREESREKYVG
jgi:hypothetical protein